MQIDSLEVCGAASGDEFLLLDICIASDTSRLMAKQSLIQPKFPISTLSFYLVCNTKAIARLGVCLALCEHEFANKKT